MGVGQEFCSSYRRVLRITVGANGRMEKDFYLMKALAQRHIGNMNKTQHYITAGKWTSAAGEENLLTMQ
jgi:hypothetical protein